MRVLILGGSGMLGHQLCRVLPTRMETWATLRGREKDYRFPPDLGHIETIEGVLAEDISTVREAIKAAKPDAVINAVGIVKQRDEAKQAIPSIQVNALFPHQLASLCADAGSRLVQISTDCVFSGLRGMYTEADSPDPVDLYGRSKLIGELNRPNCITIRTSIVGWQLAAHSSLLEWFASQRGSRIKGYKEAIFSGLSTLVFAELIAELIETRPDVNGLYHVVSEPISKHDLLVSVAAALNWTDITIEPDNRFHCDRSLDGTRFVAATGWHSPSWDEMIAGLAAEWPTYEKLRST